MPENEAREARLAELLYTRFFLMKIVYNNNKDCEVNGGKGLNITDVGMKLELRLNRSVGHAEVSEDIKRLQQHGLLLAESGGGGQKLVKLSPECRIVFEKLVEIAGRIE